MSIVQMPPGAGCRGHMSDDILTDDEKARFTLALVEQCVRNTALEDLHAGTVPSSATGDFSPSYSPAAWDGVGGRGVSY